MAVKIITDSTSDLSLEQAAQLGVEVLPLRVIFGETEYIDGVTLTAAQFYEKLAQSDVLPHTSQITPMEFSRVFDRLTANGDEVVGIFISSELSGTFQSARLAAADQPGIYLVDSRLVTFALGTLVRICLLYTSRFRRWRGSWFFGRRIRAHGSAPAHLLLPFP